MTRVINQYFYLDTDGSGECWKKTEQKRFRARKIDWQNCVCGQVNGINFDVQALAQQKNEEKKNEAQMIESKRESERE